MMEALNRTAIQKNRRGKEIACQNVYSYVKTNQSHWKARSQKRGVRDKKIVGILRFFFSGSSEMNFEVK